MTRVFNEPEYLEEVAGLTELKRKAQEAMDAMEAMDLSDGESGGESDCGGGDDDDDFQLL